MAGFVTLIMPKRSKSITCIVEICARLLTGAENSDHYRRQLHKVTGNMLAVFGHLLDLTITIGHTTTDQAVQVRMDELVTR